MNILGIDASNKGIIIALKKDNKIFVKESYEKNSGTYIITLINEILKENNLTIDDINLYGCTIGPGSFTGIRIAIAAIQGLLFNRNKKVVPIISTEILFKSSSHLTHQKIAILKRARVDAAYIHIFNNGISEFGPELVEISKIPEITDGAILLGEEAEYFKEKLKLPNILEYAKYNPESLIEQIIENNEKSVSPSELKVLYLQKPLAVENFEKKHNISIDNEIYN
ncbi:universal bacterial protein YeaZ [Marinitoga piezophila KA3]|uniref:Universal bacterial protein YeaZ n=1 Tax=Marinitoga piezophila (strain DSM 14283 / JCM 11233 / KA3) TaxID=443254 RepID=H2J6L0_MARPK|nr:MULTISPECIES: tRNA (adenosine(37)-N6)-threonylcarbamoyltransferase complex dimerization subunit type 1 TsaB [Marinitoga]AEX85195.1 universal bacterial protein YeaZ [Marinitoga piezophila KA3]